MRVGIIGQMSKRAPCVDNKKIESTALDRLLGQKLWPYTRRGFNITIKSKTRCFPFIPSNPILEDVFQG